MNGESQDRGTDSEIRIGLSLSGGGFRATLFHIGVVRFLVQSGLLRHVTDICSVSGGSILAAHLYCLWRSYEREDTFEDAVRPLIRTIEVGIRERILRRMPLVWVCQLFGRFIPILRRYSTTYLLQRAYDQLLFHGRGLAGSCERSFHLVATDLTSPHTAICFGPTTCERHPHLAGGGGSFSPGKLRLSLGVTASSAFPGVFQPVVLRAEEVPVGQREFGAAFRYLTDGGVFDNHGVRALRDVDKGASFDLAIISDAGARPDDDFERQFTGAWPTLLRVWDTMGARVSQCEREAADPRRECWIAIHDTDDNSRTVDPQIQAMLPSVRTDLDSFDRILIRSLICHGYLAAKRSIFRSMQQLEEHGETETPLYRLLTTASNKPANPWEPYDHIPSTGNVDDDRKTVAELRHRNGWRELRRFVGFGGDGVALFAYIAIAVVLCSAAPWLATAVRLSIAAIAAYLEPSPLPLPQNWSSPVEVQVANKAPELDVELPEKPSQSDLRRAGEAKPWQAIRDFWIESSNTENQQVYLVTQVDPFQRRYLPFGLKFGHASSTTEFEITTGVVFLRSTGLDGTPLLRQMDFRRNNLGQIVGNGIKIEAAEPGEYLWMLVLVKGANLPFSGEELKKFTLVRD